ncbi:hypothetical protein [Luteitalea sp.]|uniref:hypothetical protein n=1 Tax=Luteitalea sp. TaxID=2004800 RepID=UPI0025C04D5D|nr:hypothetical protein [Luteitalea sp.]
MSFVAGLEPWILYYSYGLIVVFMAGLLVLVVGARGAWRRLASAARQLSDLSPADAMTGATDHSYRAMVAVIEKLRDGGEPWWDAVRPTVTTYETYDRRKDPQVGYFVTESVEESVAGASRAGDRWLAVAHVVPGVLTSLGLLGTFVALLLGLRGLQKTAEGIWAIDPLVANLSGKFVTSIVALALSVVFVLIELTTRTVVVRARHQLAQALSRVLPLLSTSHLLLNAHRESVRRGDTLQELSRLAEAQTTVLKALHVVGERQVAQLEHFNTDLAVSIGSAMDARLVPVLERLLQSTNDLHSIQAGLGEELFKEVGNKISGAVSGAAGQEMRAMTEAISESIRSLNEAAQAMRDGQSKLVEVTSAIIGQMNHSFGENSTRLNDVTENVVRNVVEQISGAAGGFSTTIGGAGQEVATALLTTSAHLQKVVDECQRIVEHTGATMQGFDGLVTRVSFATQDVVGAHEALKETAMPLREVATRTASLIGSVDRQANTIGAAAESLKATSENLKNMQDTLQASWADYERRFAGVDQSLGNSLDSMRNGFELYAEKIRDLNAGLDTHLSKALSDLSSVINEFHETVEDLQAALPVQAAQGQRRP